MQWSWILTSLEAVLMVLLSTAGIYLSMILLTRVSGLRSFSKMSGFDFAVTVAIGSVLATTIVTEDPPLFQAAVALAALYGIQMLVATLRIRSPAVSAAVDNEPLLLMAGEEVLTENLRRAQVTEADVRAKLREANVLDPREVRAVVLETTGDVSVLHGPPDGAALDPGLLEGVVGSERVADAGGDPSGGPEGSSAGGGI